ncbi:MAG: hypothetical protein QOI06_2775 [Nocardioidaceae bacterium]|jgi:uncharacterized membrane protein YkvA (DUF1232 family)|nr:hypothetical protein [Nocardioidaceae bacterium]
MWWHILVAGVTGLLVVYLVLIVILWRAQRRHPDPSSLRDTLRLLPDVLRLLRRLAGDPDVPGGVRIRLILLIAYLVSPVDLIPDFIPIIGYADDALLVAITLRSTIRHAGPQAIERHWPGTPDGLRTILMLAGQTRYAT